MQAVDRITRAWKDVPPKKELLVGTIVAVALKRMLPWSEKVMCTIAPSGLGSGIDGTDAINKINTAKTPRATRRLRVIRALKRSRLRLPRSSLARWLLALSSVSPVLSLSQQSNIGVGRNISVLSPE